MDVLTSIENGIQNSITEKRNHEKALIASEEKNHSIRSSFATQAVHAGQDSHQWAGGDVIPPISVSSTYRQSSPDAPREFFYSRCGNPTRKCLENALAALEGGKFGLVFSSGVATITTVTHLLKKGEHVVCGDDVYGGTNYYFNQCASKIGVETTFVDETNAENVKNAIKENTRMIWLETPTNPTMKLCDIQAIADAVKQKKQNLIFVVDNTFMSPYFQNPLSMGADIVMHSVTKYINGHSDAVMGAIITNRSDLNERLRSLQTSLGAVSSPFDCFLVNRGLKTLQVRMERHMKNGLDVARYLQTHPMVRKVLHPGLENHEQHKLAMKQCSGFSGMVSFYIKGGSEEAKTFVQSLKIFILAVSLGGIESLAEIPALMTHANVPVEQRLKIGIDDGLIRLSVGIEDSADLIADLRQAFEAVGKLKK